MIAAIRDPDSRAYAYRRVSLLVADSDRVKKLSLLNESLLAARAVVEPAESCSPSRRSRPDTAGHGRG